MPFNQKPQKFNAKINAVTIGSGDKTVTIGGENSFPFYTFDAVFGKLTALSSPNLAIAPSIAPSVKPYTASFPLNTLSNKVTLIPPVFKDLNSDQSFLLFL